MQPPTVVGVKEKAANRILPATTVSKIQNKPFTPPVTTARILPEPGIPDESDAGILTGKKKDNAPLKKKVSKREDDILNDGTPANGFNTGIKKDTKRKNR